MQSMKEEKLLYLSQKSPLWLMEIYGMDVPELKKRIKAFRLFVCLTVCLYVLSVSTMTFEGVCRSKQKLVGVFYI